MTVRAHAEVLDGFTSVLRSTEQEGVGSGGGTESELVEGKNLTTGLLNTGAGGSSETKGGNGELGDSQHAVVVGDGSNNDNGLSLLFLGHVGDDARQADGRSVCAGHEKAAEDDLVEVGIGTTCKRKSLLTSCYFPRLASNFCSFFFLILLSIEGKHTGQEAVELHQELKVDVLALGRLSVCAAHMVTVQIDTCRNLSIRSIPIK